MNPKITLKKNEKIIAHDIFDINLDSHKFNEHENLFDFDILNGTEKVISFDDLKIYFGELSSDGLVNFDINYDMPTMMINFEIEGGYKLISTEQDINITINPNHYNCMYGNEFKGVMSYFSEKRKYFTLLISEKYILDIFNVYFKKISQPYVKLIKSKKTFSLFNESKKIPYIQLRLIEDIVNCYYDIEVKKTFIKSKIIEIFAHIFSDLTKPNIVYSQEVVQLASKARAFVMGNFANNISLDSISKAIGTNKTTLKYIFKEVYGETVMLFRLRIRMEEAKKLLLSQKYSISEIAYTLGYKKPQHFTTAFKKNFDCLPSVFKKECEMKK